MTPGDPTAPRILSPAELGALVAELVGAGTRVIAPAPAPRDPGRTEYRPIRSLEEAALRGPLPRHSLKELFLPPSEVLLRYRQRKDGVDLEEVPVTFPPQVVLGARPCDAAGVATLDRVMGWDYRDELWFGRREATTVVTLACPGVDSACFCAALGLGPDSTKGADAVLVPLDPAPVRPSTPVASRLREAVDGFLAATEPFPGAASEREGGAPADGGPHAAAGYLARAVTAKGAALLGARGMPADAAAVERAERFARAARDRVARSALPAERRAALERLPEWLAGHFDHPVWRSLALRCHGCGACAAVCPTCHCFDIVDEHDSWGAGARRRNWDFCQSAKFTVHASGHNPRPRQTERLRQRVMHKFSTYPRRFEAFLCTGCGRCARACGAGLNLPEVLDRLVGLSAAEEPGSAP